MRQLCVSVVIVVLAIGWASCDIEGAQQSHRLLVLFVDDLHFEFRSTPRMRELLVRRVLPQLIRDGDSVSLLTTGYSSVAIAPTTDTDVLLAGLRKITGNGLRADEILEPKSSDERLRRARVAIATARNAIRILASMTAGRTAFVYVSSGYGEQRVAEDLSDLASEAYRAGVAIYAFEGRGLVGGTAPTPGPGSDAAWTTYYRDAQESLRALADSTGGLMVSMPQDLDDAIAQLTR